MLITTNAALSSTLGKNPPNRKINQPEKIQKGKCLCLDLEYLNFVKLHSDFSWLEYELTLFSPATRTTTRISVSVWKVTCLGVIRIVPCFWGVS